MTHREKEIVSILKDEPTISQDDLAKRLNITRSSVAVHITNLVKKGIILGKGYIVSEEPYIVVIGGSNIDIQGIPLHPLIQKDSNIGYVNISHGGVGRNIAENCTRLNIPTRLLSVLGQDLYGQSILSHANSIGLHMNDSLIHPHYKTSTYLSILDQHHDLALAINDMDIMNSLTKEFIQSKKRLLEHAQLIVCDTNLTEEALESIFQIGKEIPIFIDTVSSTKALKIKPYLHKVHTIKPNKAELYALVDPTHTLDLHSAAKLLPCPYAYISLGDLGVLIKNHDQLTHLTTPPIDIANATGAGDAFMSGIVYGYLNQFSPTNCAFMAMSAARITLQSEATISPLLNEEACLTTMKEIYHV